MKKAVLIVVLIGVLSWAAPKSDDYPITVHVHSTHLRERAGAVGPNSMMLILHVSINGKKYELEAAQDGHQLLAIGDYKARLIQDWRTHNTTYESSQIYELLFPDQRTRKFIVVGQSE